MGTIQVRVSPLQGSQRFRCQVVTANEELLDTLHDDMPAAWLAADQAIAAHRQRATTAEWLGTEPAPVAEVAW